MRRAVSHLNKQATPSLPNDLVSIPRYSLTSSLVLFTFHFSLFTACVFHITFNRKSPLFGV